MKQLKDSVNPVEKVLPVTNSLDPFDVTTKSTPIVPPISKPKIVATRSTEIKKKQKTYPHLNLRCPHCGYYAKTTHDMLYRARLNCPVDGNMLLTKTERGETRGRKS